MVTNLEYLKTAIEALESSETTLWDQRKILKVVAQICEKNINRIETDLVDKVENRLYNTHIN